MSSDSFGAFCRRIIRAYRQHFPVRGGGGWLEGDTLFFSFNHPQSTLFLHVTPSDLALERPLNVNLSCPGNELSVSVNSTGIQWNSPKPKFFTSEELQNIENLACRLYLIALDSADSLQLITAPAS